MRRLLIIIAENVPNAAEKVAAVFREARERRHNEKRAAVKANGDKGSNEAYLWRDRRGQ